MLGSSQRRWFRRPFDASASLECIGTPDARHIWCRRNVRHSPLGAGNAQLVAGPGHGFVSRWIGSQRCNNLLHPMDQKPMARQERLIHCGTSCSGESNMRIARVVLGCLATATLALPALTYSQAQPPSTLLTRGAPI